MIKLLILLTLTFKLFAQETCYTVQLFSKTNSAENVLALKKKKYPDNCQTMTVGKFLTVRCGCYEGYSQAQKVLPALKSFSAGAGIVTTNKFRFAKPQAIATPPKKKLKEPQETKKPQKLNSAKEPKEEKEKIVLPTVIKINKDLNVSLKPKPKEMVSLNDDILFHANRESGLSVYEAINKAISASPKISAAYQSVVQDNQKLKEVEAGHLPTVDFSGDTGYEVRQLSDDPLYTNSPSQTTISKYRKTDLFLTISENLWNGGSIENAIDEKDASLKAGLYDYRDKIEALVVDVASTYFDVVYGEIALKISLKNMKSYEKILNIVTIKEKNGAATTGDVNFILANVDNAKTSLVQKQKALSDAKAQYVYLLQTEAVEDLPYEISTDFYNKDLNSSLKDAKTYNAKLLKQHSYIEATKFGFLATKGNFHPKVDLSINGESKNEFDIGFGQREKLNALVTFNYNLYNGHKDEATAVRLLAKMKEQKFLQQDIARNLIFEIKVMHRSVSSLSESLKLTENEVLAARKSC